MNKKHSNSASTNLNTPTPKKQNKNKQSTPGKNTAGNGTASCRKQKTPNSQNNANGKLHGGTKINSNGIEEAGAQPKYAGAQFQTAPLPSQLPSIPSTWVSSSFHSNGSPSIPTTLIGSPGTIRFPILSLILPPLLKNSHLTTNSHSSPVHVSQ